MSIDPSIKEHNYQFIRNLDNTKAPIEVDGSGKLVQNPGLVQRITGLVSRVFHKISLEEALRESLDYSLSTIQVEWDKDHVAPSVRRAFLEGVLHNLDTHGVLTEGMHLEILELYQPVIASIYQQRFQELINSGVSELVAESTVSIEMSQDTLIPIEQKKKIGAIPTDSRSGNGGSYIIRDRQGKNIGLFKPSDEEAYMSNNSRGYLPTDKRFPGAHYDGISIGTSWKREIAAFEVAKNMPGVRVPETVKFKTSLPENPKSELWIEKEGSLQKFVKECDVLGEACANFDEGQRVQTGISAKEIHGTILFDCLTGNKDRHLGNLFVSQEDLSLVLFDHGLCFCDELIALTGPPNTRTLSYLVTWPQAEVSIDPDTRNAFLEMDIDVICSQIKSQDVLTDRSLMELRLRHSILRRILLEASELTAFQISALFMPIAEPSSSEEFYTTIAEEVFHGVAKDFGDRGLLEESEQVKLQAFEQITNEKLDGFPSEALIRDLKNRK